MKTYKTILQKRFSDNEVRKILYHYWEMKMNVVCVESCHDLDPDNHDEFLGYIISYRKTKKP